jgi:hypothetical protein
VAVPIRVLDIQARDDHRAILNAVLSVLDQLFFIPLPPSMSNTVNNDAAEEKAEEKEEQEEQTSEPEVRGRGQCKKIAAHRYLGPAWEEH